MNALPILAVSHDEQLVDADARRTRPALAALAAVTLLPVTRADVPAALELRAEPGPDITADGREHPDMEPKPVTVLIGRSELDDGKGLAAIWWPVAGVEYEIEAAYDPAMISLAGAETRLRAQLAERGMAVAEFLNKDGSLTAAQRTLTLDEGLAAHRTAPIETELRDIDSETRADLPWLAAEIVVMDDKPQAYGRTTRVWLSYGTATGEMTPAQGREALAVMREFADRYEALLNLADEIAADDFAGDPEIARLDSEAEGARIKARTAELLAAQADR